MTELSEVLAGRRRYACWQAAAVAWLRSLAEGCADLIFCSPPYSDARLYLEGGQNLGVTRKTEAWVAWMLEVVEAALDACKGLCAFVVDDRTENYRYNGGPQLLMADLIRKGICLRKPPAYVRIGVPGSGGADWLRSDYEPIVCVTHGGKLPWSDNTAMGHPPVWKPGGEPSHRTVDGTRANRRPRHAPRGRRNGDAVNGNGYAPPTLANPGNIVEAVYSADEVAA